MKLQIEYDDKGEIRSIAGPTLVTMPHGARALVGRAATRGHYIAEIEVEDVKHDRDFENMKKAKEHYRVIDHPHRPRLAAK